MRHDISKLMDEFSSLIREELLNHSLPKTQDCPSTILLESINYTMSTPGKCIRSFLASVSAQIFGVSTKNTLQLGAAIETMHTYSLIHDDLPSMDNSATRRGKSSCHKKFGEAVAILTGDALLTLAFELLSSIDGDCTIKCDIIGALSRACGYRGMISGQVLDIIGMPSPEAIDQMHLLKTAKLFEASCEAGAILGRAQNTDRAALASYGAYLGCIFQAKDDLKDVGEDSAGCNMAQILGIEETMKHIDALFGKCDKSLDKLSADATILRELAASVRNVSL